MVPLEEGPVNPPLDGVMLLLVAVFLPLEWLLLALPEDGAALSGPRPDKQ